MPPVANVKIHRFVIFALMLGFACFFTNFQAFSAPPATVKIHTQQGITQFSVKVAKTEEEQSRGLMFQTKLARNEGMLFPQDPPRMVSMWMKNTPLSLDMIFIDEHNRISKIEKRTTPQSLTAISSVIPASAVLEIAGGTCDEKHIKVGNKVEYEMAF